MHGEPEAILLVEFDEGEFENKRRLKELAAMMGDLGFSFDKTGAKWGGVVEVLRCRRCRPRSRTCAPPASTS